MFFPHIVLGLANPLSGFLWMIISLVLIPFQLATDHPPTPIGDRRVDRLQAQAHFAKG